MGSSTTGAGGESSEDRIVTVSSWRELDDAISEVSGPRGPHPRGGPSHSAVVFRGRSRPPHSHLSGLARLAGEYPAVERHLIRNFRKYAHRQAPGPTIWDWLALGQHHGLPTRLVDWTFSPLVALHFATAVWPHDEAMLIGLDCEAAHRLLPGPLREVLDHEGAVLFTTEMLARRAPDLDSFGKLAGAEPFLALFEPPSLDERIVTQSSVLSALSDVTWPVERWLNAHPDLWWAWRIPPEVKAEVRERLDQAGITERALLPGLDGLAAWLRRYYSPEVCLEHQGDECAPGTTGNA
ncbi:FRG domain-containing protein [Nonomuraea sp. SMC257]|uniref:FRG domain-containing protein n=1 Tax=Nonomuraea montanisoli TaxID=2741721 RepID=A0A7Y6IGB5_9ACTN|nr:FRG domain-containing protein [Nonomuraea montanisoli]NUW36294.1 FRG domain-containing protein [Nonomuraea montanisoli]